MPGSLITAGTTRTQAGATLITESVTRVDVSTATTGLGDGVILPSVDSGTVSAYSVINNTLNVIQLYAQGSDTINGVAGSSGIPIYPGVVTTIGLAAPGAWHIISGGGIGLKPSGVLAQVGAASASTGTTNTVVLATVPIPAGGVTGNGSIVTECEWSFPSNTNTKNLTVKLAGVTILNLLRSAADGNVGSRMTVKISNRGVQNQQVVWPSSTSFGLTATAPTVTNIDLTQPQSLTFEVNTTGASDTLTLENYLVEIKNP